MKEIKRCFLGMEIDCPWPDMPQKGRILKERNRHVTLAFFGNISSQNIEDIIYKMKNIPRQIGAAGIFDKVLFLPIKCPRTVSWNISWMNNEKMEYFLRSVLKQLQEIGFIFKTDNFLWHLTLCREDFQKKEWEKKFKKLPLFVKKLHLYESMEFSEYKSLWNRQFIMPFETKEHTADLAFIVRGENFQDIYHNAQIALAFFCPEIIAFLSFDKKNKNNIYDVIVSLNDIIFEFDKNAGSVFKAVSFNTNITVLDKNILQWEMIVDV
jgi:RNA 2',3'-cyclic 3'-phosphodiesterase